VFCGVRSGVASGPRADSVGVPILTTLLHPPGPTRPPQRPPPTITPQVGKPKRTDCALPIPDELEAQLMTLAGSELREAFRWGA
jgi:hypothetical protein